MASWCKYLIYKSPNSHAKFSSEFTERRLILLPQQIIQVDTYVIYFAEVSS
jgi:hypothetical protein